MTPIARVRKAASPVDAVVRPPGSKSATIRALAAGALASGRSHLYGALRAEDSDAMLRVVRGYGIDVDDSADPWAVDGRGGHLITPTGSLDLGESGLTARIAIVLAVFAEGPTEFTGRGRLNERPMQPLIDSLHEQGVDIRSEDGHLPITVAGQGGLWGGRMRVDCSKSSQYATALLIAAPCATEQTSVRLEGLAGSSRYIDMTVDLMEAFGARVSPNITGFDAANDGYRPTDYVIEPDVSAAVYPMVAAAITGGKVLVEGLHFSTAQPDIKVAYCLAEMGCEIEDVESGLLVSGPEHGLRAIHVDMSDAPDGSLGLATACLFAEGESRIDGLHSLQYKESDRLRTITRELRALGGDVTVDGQNLVVRRSDPVGASVDSHGDHRIAMAAALVGLKVDGVVVTGADAVAKTWPEYWEMLEMLTD
ncbi:MAG: 3-phosphoshikimate 1-carboxyvinyltransferase [Actinomycetota bacterium]|nr:3-phosphoshikimate 1-carboxyvinyltransferase [Actinomycetota bacterium]